MSKSEHLKQQLLELIRQSAPGTRLPTERELCEQYGFARSTVNKVIVELERESYVRRRIGSGTYVMPRDTAIRYSDDPAGATGRFRVKSSSSIPTSSERSCGRWLIRPKNWR